MGELKSKIPGLLKEKGLSTPEFVRQCVIAELSHDTGYRLARGETDFNTDTLKKVAKVLGVESISDLIDLSNGRH